MNVLFIPLFSLPPHPTYATLRADGATIKSISENIVVDPGDEAKLSCAVDGKFWTFSAPRFHPLLCFDGCFPRLFSAQFFTGLIIVMEETVFEGDGEVNSGMKRRQFLPLL